MSFLYHLTAFWSYITLGAVSIIIEELAPIAGGVAAHQGYLQPAWVAWSCGLGSWLADIALYYLGRWRGAWVRRRWPRLGRAFTRTLMGVRHAPWRSSLAVRYAYGLRLTLPIACGVAHVPVVEYLAGSAISAFTWASLFTVLGWVFGRSAEIVLRHMRRYEDVLGLAVAGLVGVLVLLYVRRTRPEDDSTRAFERELDLLSGEHRAVPGTNAPPPAEQVAADPAPREPRRDEEAPPTTGRRPA